MTRYCMFSVLVCISVCIYACVNDNTGNTIQDNKTSSSSQVSVKSLDDPTNPYAGDYSEFDKWIYVHMVAERSRYSSQEEMPEGWVLIGAQATSDGCLIPYRQRLVIKYEGLRNPGKADNGNALKRVYAEGNMPDDVRSIRRRILGEVKAAYFNCVPDWVLSTKHSAYKLVPNGDIIAVDFSPNSSKSAGNSLCGSCDADELWYRYSPNGELLGLSERGWWWLYYNAVQSEAPDGSCTSRADGYTYFENWETGEITSVWSWDGTRLSKDGLPSQLGDLIPFLMLDHDDLSLINEFQANKSGS